MLYDQRTSRQVGSLNRWLLRLLRFRPIMIADCEQMVETMPGYAKLPNAFIESEILCVYYILLDM